MELAWREEEGEGPGHFGGPFGVNMYTEEMRNKEISNGRFAMICVLGIFAAEVATGKDAIQQFGRAAVAPTRSREAEAPGSRFAGASLAGLRAAEGR